MCGRCAAWNPKLNSDLFYWHFRGEYRGVIEYFVSKQRSTLHRLFPALALRYAEHRSLWLHPLGHITPELNYNSALSQVKQNMSLLENRKGVVKGVLKTCFFKQHMHEHVSHYTEDAAYRVRTVHLKKSLSVHLKPRCRLQDILFLFTEHKSVSLQRPVCALRWHRRLFLHLNEYELIIH